MAGTRVGQAWYELRANDAPLKAAVTKAEGDIKASGNRAATGFSGAFQRGVGGIKQSLGALTPMIGAMGGAFAAAKIAGFLGDAVSAASDLAETTSKANVVFGDSADTVLKLGETSARALGMSKNAAPPHPISGSVP